jgi:diamine N-acetyltransferase
MTEGPRLEPITPDNFDAAIGIEVAPAQRRLVAPVMKSLAEAYV